MAVRLKRRAVRDLRAARDWYNERSAGVGTRFVLEFEAVIEEVESAGTEVTVLAVLHFRQHPDEWKGSP